MLFKFYPAEENLGCTGIRIFGLYMDTFKVQNRRGFFFNLCGWRRYLYFNPIRIHKG